jgi:hypothetical protein
MKQSHQDVKHEKDVAVVLKPFTKYMMTKGIKKQYIPIIYSVYTDITEANPVMASPKEHDLYKLYNKFCDALPKINLQFIDIINTMKT